MATYTNISTFTAGQVLTSSVMNDVKNNLDLTNAQSQSFARSLIYNGAMQISQRGTSTASITTNGYYTADRWQVGNTTLGTWTQSVENDAPTGSGLRRSLKMLCTTADASPAAGDQLFVNQALEGFDVQRLAKGTSSAQTLTLTFWVKANVTGTYIASLYDNDNNRHCSKSYTISASGTWEQKSITFPADTTGVLDNDNAASLVLTFYLAAGSNRTSGTLATTWASYTAANDAVGQTNLASATSNYWQVTGVQLEAGSVSTPFEFLPYGVDLARCQRYYYRRTADNNTSFFADGQCESTTKAKGTASFPVVMRTAPSGIETTGTATDYRVNHSGTVTNSSAVPMFEAASSHAGAFAFTVASGLTLGRACGLQSNASGAYIAWSAEL